MKVDINIEVDIDDVFSELSYKDQAIFIAENLDVLGGILDVVNDNFTNKEISDLINEKIEMASDEMLIEEVKRRGIVL